MKSLVLSLVVLCASVNLAFANTGTKGNHLEDGNIKIIREWK